MKSLHEFYQHEHPLLAWQESQLTEIEDAAKTGVITKQDAWRQAVKLRFTGNSALAKSCRERILVLALNASEERHNTPSLTYVLAMETVTVSPAELEQFLKDNPDAVPLPEVITSLGGAL